MHFVFKAEFEKMTYSGRLEKKAPNRRRSQQIYIHFIKELEFEMGCRIEVT